MTAAPTDERRRPYPGQHYKHGWIPVGGSVPNLGSDAPTSMSDAHYELAGLDPLAQRKKMQGWGWSEHQINEVLDAPDSMSDAHLELQGLSNRQRRKKMQSWGWTDQQIQDALAALRSDEPQGDYRRNLPAMCTRGFDFEIRQVLKGGRRLEGHVVVFGATARISDRSGDFDEEMHPGVFDRYLRNRMPVMQFDHGKDPRVGSLPMGVYDTFEPDHRGYFVGGDLIDDPLFHPIHKAIDMRAVKGMSWRMQVSEKGQKWSRRSGEVDKRDIFDADVPEAGPVVFPAYDQTSVNLRSLLAAMDAEEIRTLAHELAAHLGLAVDLPDLTGRPVARSTGGGDDDAEPQERNASPDHTTQQRADHGALQLRGILQ